MHDTCMLCRYSLQFGVLKSEQAKFQPKLCAVFPSVRFPSIAPQERFFFIFADESARAPEIVMHLMPGSFECAKPKVRCC